MIAVYDTGAGGRQIMQKAQKIRPDLIYRLYEDQEILPLGDKTPKQIRTRVTSICENLFQEGYTLVILACNTASVHTIRYLQQVVIPQKYPGCNVLGVTKPLMEYVIKEYSDYKTQKGVLLATQATITSGFYQQELMLEGFNTMESIPAVGLAEAIEYNDIQSIQEVLLHYKASLGEAQYLIFACTHYSLIREQILQLYPHLTIIDPSQYIAERILWYLEKYPKYRSI